jgi:hypothetical protein
MGSVLIERIGMVCEEGVVVQMKAFERLAVMRI